MSYECESCVNERRNACLAIRSEYRDSVADLMQIGLETAMESDGNDMIAIMEQQQEHGQLVSHTASTLREQGCTLDISSAQLLFVNETAAAITLFGMKMMEEDYDELAEIERHSAETKALLESIESVPPETKPTFTSSEIDIDEFLSRRPRRPASLSLASEGSSLEARKQAVTEAYCSERGLSPDELSLADQLELKQYLRAQGLLT